MNQKCFLSKENKTQCLNDIKSHVLNILQTNGINNNLVALNMLDLVQNNFNQTLLSHQSEKALGLDSSG